MIMTSDNDHDNKYRASPPRLNQRGWRVTKVAIYHSPSSILQSPGQRMFPEFKLAVPATEEAWPPIWTQRGKQHFCCPMLCMLDMYVL